MAISEQLQDNTAITILLLGDPGCGKSTFLSSLKTPLARPSNTNTPFPVSTTKPEILRDTDQPFLYDIRFSRKSFTLEFFDTASPNQHWTMVRPDVVVLAFDISDRRSLEGLREWRNEITLHFQHGYGEKIPVMMLGLKRDLRVEGEGVIYPQETYRIAQELRCDRYAECSAVTGELLAETFEDISRMGAMAKAGKSGEGVGGCTIL
ncbi:putative Rho-like small GTPase [Aspergillus chevalieri]|uniref:Rho-like small GTPase n=1 Tax=Aspergillus chevalieri TaxID=182096 RepID=A0A7R7VHG5_ASPCH|nr:uncharacterized protein ACHE_20177A [Aspergillus chevalieri]BCR84719.1 hypothetical protein ACHE_20177A [Aspergillus chevalieri]